MIRLDRMQYIDQSGLYAMEDVLIELNENNIKVVLVGLSNQPKYMLERIDIIPDLIPPSHIFENIEDCLFWIKNNN